jgi:hypothetical protein
MYLENNNVIIGSGDFSHKEWLIDEEKQLRPGERSGFCIRVLCDLEIITGSVMLSISSYVFLIRYWGFCTYFRAFSVLQLTLPNPTYPNLTSFNPTQHKLT